MRASRIIGSALSQTISGRRDSAALLAQVAWFNRLRVGATAGVFLLSLVANLGFGILEDPTPLYALGALIGLVDGIYFLLYPRLRRQSRAQIRRHVDLQIGIDLLILTALLHYSGGVSNPLVMFYMIHSFIAALLLSVRAAIVVVGVSFVLVSSLAFAEHSGVLPHRSLELGLMDVASVDVRGLVLFLLAFGLTQVFSIYFIATVLERLNRREDELTHLSGQLAHSEKLASIGTLAAGVSHEINNPIGVIRSKTQILRYRIEDGDSSDELQRELGTIEKHTDRIGAITEGLLAFAKEAPFELRSLDLNRLVREGLDLVAVPFRSADVSLRAALSSNGPRIRGSENHLLQVLVNIMLNARDASPAGGHVVVETYLEPAAAVVRIRDRGAGIPDEVLDKIFDPFFTTKEVGRGTGLGLAISHGIVERHGGHIEVESTMGEGSVFSVLLPVDRSGSNL
eukprot:jgi/Undpi1/11744/HiC_scaffold_37.g14039.m1